MSSLSLKSAPPSQSQDGQIPVIGAATPPPLQAEISLFAWLHHGRHHLVRSGRTCGLRLNEAAPTACPIAGPLKNKGRIVAHKAESGGMVARPRPPLTPHTRLGCWVPVHLRSIVVPSETQPAFSVSVGGDSQKLLSNWKLGGHAFRNRQI